MASLVAVKTVSISGRYKTYYQW